MPMPDYVVSCTARGCTEVAVYKIAARWSDAWLVNSANMPPSDA